MICLHYYCKYSILKVFLKVSIYTYFFLKLSSFINKKNFYENYLYKFAFNKQCFLIL